ncbi:hypothetical protein C2S51_001583 [Perilla frutescens var. frutescens]|nr:hypothetical protein C2S51_001583 [Perilla frutescens var. frutescens]
MGKEGELWDDSALIKAFDHAISKYKATKPLLQILRMYVYVGECINDFTFLNRILLQVMHGKSGEKPIIDSEENFPDNGSTQHVQNDDNLFDGLETTTKTGDTAEILQSKEDSPLELGSSAQCVGSSNIQEHNDPPTNDIPATRSVDSGEQTVLTDLKCQNEATCYSDGAEEYSKLLNKYYEVESQRQHILQQLNQYSNWNYQYPVSSTSTAEEYQASVPQPYETVACQCAYGCQNWVVPCNSSPAACSGGNYIDPACHAKGSQNEKAVSQKDPDFVNMAMVAAEKALSLTKEANRGTEKQLGMEIGQFPESKSSTDLDVVLKAWYTAGLYTGKYLSEQSSEGRKQGQGI